MKRNFWLLTIILLLIIDLFFIILINIPEKKETSMVYIEGNYTYGYFYNNIFDNINKNIHITCIKERCYNVSVNGNYFERGSKVYILGDNCLISNSRFKEGKTYYLCDGGIK